MRRRTLVLRILVVLTAAWLVALRPASLGGPTTFVVVSGTSMEPTFHDGDLVVAIDRGAYESGDVVAFRAAGAIVIHRIIGGSAASGFVVRGDNRAAPDRWRPTSDDILGAAALHLPGAGRVVATLRHPAVAGGLAGLLVFLMAVGSGPRRRPRQAPPPSVPTAAR